MACDKQCHGHQHCWDLDEVPAIPKWHLQSPLASLLEEEVVVQWELPPLWAMGEEAVNSLEGEAALRYNLFLQGDLCSLL